MCLTAVTHAGRRRPRVHARVATRLTPSVYTDRTFLNSVDGKTTAGYRAAFAILLALELGALAWFYVLRPRNAGAAKP